MKKMNSNPTTAPDRAQFALYKTLESFLEAFGQQFIGYSKFKTLFPSDFCQEFFEVCALICRVESQSFQTPEDQETCQNAYQRLQGYTAILEQHLSLHPNKAPTTTPQENAWRLIAGMLCCFAEWCSEVDYCTQPPDKQTLLWAENPLQAFAFLIEAAA